MSEPRATIPAGSRGDDRSDARTLSPALPDGRSALPELVVGGVEHARVKATVAAALFDEPLVAPKIGRYHVRRRLGAGGMGEVFAAHDPELDREVAIKLALPERAVAGAPGDSRLLREAQLLARLTHPNVVRVFEVGVWEQHVYIAMELVRGETLRAWQDASPRPWPQILQRYLAAARGLAAAHTAGLVHRDFKPDNVLVDGDEHVYVVDFGLARPVEPAPTTCETHITADSGPAFAPLTSPGTVAGTPGYMAPEQLAGHPADRRSDTFSFCASLFEALHGTLPFAGSHASERAAAIARGPLAARNPGVPRWLNVHLARGLAADPSRRFQSFPELIAALERDPAVRWRRIIVASALLTFGAAAGLLFSGRDAPALAACAAVERTLVDVWSPARRTEVAAALANTGTPHAHDTWQRVDSSLSAYAAAWGVARRRACEDIRAPAVLLDARIACLDARARNFTALVDTLATSTTRLADRAIQALDVLPSLAECDDTDALLRIGALRPPGASPATDAMRDTLARARTHAALGGHREAQRMAEQALASAQAAADVPAQAEAMWIVGVARNDDGRDADADDALLTAAVKAEAARLDDLAADAWLALVQSAAHRQLDPERAALWARQAYAALDRVADQGRRRSALLSALGVAASRAGRREEALALHRRAVELLRAQGERAGGLASAMHHLANALDALDEHDEARATFAAALELATAEFGPRHPETAAVTNDLGMMLADLGELPQARSSIEQALAIWTDAQGALCLDCGRAHTGLARLAADAGELSQAEGHLLRALEIYRRLHATDHVETASTLVNLGAVRLLRGDATGALVAYRDGLAVQQRRLPPHHPDITTTVVNLGEALVALHRHAEALMRLDAIEPIVRAARPPDRDLLALLLRNKGQALLATDRLAPARAALTEATSLRENLPANPWESAQLHLQTARLYSAEGDGCTARIHAETAAAVADTLGDGGQKILDESRNTMASITCIQLGPAAPRRSRP